MNALKSKLRSALLVALVFAYAVMWVGGVGHYVLRGAPPLAAPWAASLFLLLAGVLVIVTAPRPDRRALSLAAALGFVAEVLGVHYGFIFSPYHYTGVLQPQLLGVPLVMLSAWLVLVAYIKQMVASLRLTVWPRAILAAAWMTAIDLVIDPLAAGRLAYWHWERAGIYYGIPAHNFVGWFVISFIIFAIIRRRAPNKHGVARYVGLSIISFFTIIALASGLTLVGLVGLSLCLLHAKITLDPAAAIRHGGVAE